MSDDVKELTPAALRKEVLRLRSELARTTALLETANALPLSRDEAGDGVFIATYTASGQSAYAPVRAGRTVIRQGEAEYSIRPNQEGPGIEVMASGGPAYSLSVHPQAANVLILHYVRRPLYREMQANG